MTDQTDTALRQKMRNWAAGLRASNPAGGVVDAGDVANTLEAMADPERCLHCGSRSECRHDPEDR